MANQTKAHIKLDGTNVEFPNKIILGANPSWGKKLIIGGDANNSTVNDASIGVTNGNLHIDAASGNATYLNFYDGTSGVAFGSGAGAAVAWMGPDGDLWKGSSDNNGSKYWHAGNDGADSGLDADTVDTLHASSFLRSDTSDQMDGTLTIQSGGANTYGRIRGYPNDNHFITIRGKVATGTSTLSITGDHHTTFVEHADEADEGWYFVSKASGNYTEKARIDGVGQMYIGGNKVWHAGNDGASSGLDADTLDGVQLVDLDHAEGFKTWDTVSASGATARRFHIGRLYGTPAHWDSNWQNIEFHITAEGYESGTLKYRIQGDYGGSGTQANMLKLWLTEVHGPMVGRFRLVLGSAVDAGWDHSGQDTFYMDLYAESAYYSSWKVHAKTYGHGYQTSNPSSGGATTVFYSSPTITNISDFSVTHNDIYVRGAKVWTQNNDGASSGLDADLLDGQQESYFLNTSGTAQTKSGNLTINGNLYLGDQMRIGDDAWIEDFNVANAIKIKGNQDNANGYIAFGSQNDLLGRAGTGALTWAGSTIWHAGNDGAGSGLDADLLDGLQGASYLRSNASDDFGSNSANQTITFKVNSGQYIASGGSESRFPIQIYAPTTNGGDAAIAFHISGDYAAYFGLASDWNDLAWGGWSVGSSTKYRILHTGNYSSWNRDDRYYTESEIDTKLGGKLGETTGAFGLSKKVDFYIYGDDNKYYPVIIDGGSASTLKRYQIYRGYSETAPSTWNTSTHKGSLTFDYEIRVGGWGGYTNMYSVNYFGEQYSRQCAKLAFANHTMQHVVWLRGGGSGGAIYHIESTANISVTPHYDTSASNYVSGTGWRTYDNSNDAYDTYYNYLDLGSTADSATQTTIVDHMFIKANGAVNENTGGGSFSSRFVTSDADDSLSGQYSFTKTNDHAIKVGTIRGTAVGSQSGEFIQLYERVNIGGPSGWGASNTAAPSYGLSTYGGASLATNTGNVAIGHTSPACKLHVKGAAVDNQALTIVENTYSGGGVYYPAFKALNTYSNHSYGIVGEFRTQGTSTDRPAILFSNGHTNNNWQVGQGVYGANDNFGIGYRTAHPDTTPGWSTARLVIDTSGRVGIGTTSPDSNTLLDVAGAGHFESNSSARVLYLDAGSSNGNIVQFHKQGTNKWELVGRDGTFYIYKNDGTGSGYKWQIDSSGNHTFTGTATFNSTVTATSFIDGSYYLNPADANTSLYMNGDLEIASSHSRGNLYIYYNHGDTGNSGTLTGWVSEPGITYHSSGIGGNIHRSGPYYGRAINSGYGVYIRFHKDTGNMTFANTTGTSGSSGQQGSVKFTMAQNGTFTAVGDVVAYSDAKLKENVKTLDGKKVLEMRGVSFDRKDTGKKGSGLIAQEVQKIAPELVHENEDGTLGVAYGNLTGYLIEAIKELKAEIEELKKQIK